MEIGGTRAPDCSMTECGRLKDLPPIVAVDPARARRIATVRRVRTLHCGSLGLSS
jgi:hypothetical protein